MTRPPIHVERRGQLICVTLQSIDGHTTVRFLSPEYVRFVAEQMVACADLFEEEAQEALHWHDARRGG